MRPCAGAGLGWFAYRCCEGFLELVRKDGGTGSSSTRRLVQRERKSMGMLGTPARRSLRSDLPPYGLEARLTPITLLLRSPSIVVEGLRVGMAPCRPNARLAKSRQAQYAAPKGSLTLEGFVCRSSTARTFRPIMPFIRVSVPSPLPSSIIRPHFLTHKDIGECTRTVLTCLKKSRRRCQLGARLYRDRQAQTAS